MIKSYNEWDKLEEVIIGKGCIPSLPALELSFQLFFNDNIHGQDFNEWNSKQPIKKHHIQELEEDVEGFVELVKSHGIRVRRPKPMTKIQKIKTPYWNSTTFYPLNVRDQTLIVGNKIIETPPLTRFRYFENDAMKHLFMEYFREGAGWIVAPRPMILDDSFDFDYILKTADENTKKWYDEIQEKTPHEFSYGFEMMFDAANCMRFGEDIIMNVSTQNHILGAKWLQTILPDHNIQTVELVDSHIDSTIIPLRPGLLLTDPQHLKDKTLLPKWLQKWDMVIAPISSHPEEYEDDDILLASRSIDINVLSIDTHTIICHDRYYNELQPILKPYGIECIPCKLRHSRIFSGAFHCITLDVKRNCKYENYR
jgi:glycine amidinotransferase